jgi:hypothetical protein
VDVPARDRARLDPHARGSSVDRRQGVSGRSEHTRLGRRRLHLSEPGAALLIVLGITAWLWKRRGGTGAPALVVALLATVYVLALGVAWFAMSGKPS